ILNTVFKATIIVAGINNINNAPKIEETTSPSPSPINEPLTLSLPNLLTITNTAPAIRKPHFSYCRSSISNSKQIWKRKRQRFINRARTRRCCFFYFWSFINFIYSCDDNCGFEDGVQYCESLKRILGRLSHQQIRVN